MKKRLFVFLLFFGVFCWNDSFLFAQPVWTFNPFGKEAKPRQYKDKKLGSEKTATTKFNFLRRFSQNKFSQFNYFFNANNKLNQVLEIAKSQQQDDYTSLLSFYPYSLDNTATQQIELDSVIMKCTAGILLHDLRTAWVDNMYLLIGKSYYYRKLFDSASLTFQFINYNLFPRKKNENDNRIVGRNMNPGLKKITIANKEKRNIIDRAFTRPPSRNDALIWLTRTYIDMDQFGEAAGMINILQDDPFLPKRLKDDLDEVTAYWYYKQNAYDSAAFYLEKGITTADVKADKIRWQFLLAQMYELSGQFTKAGKFYTQVGKHTVNPLMDISARLNNAKMLQHKGDKKELENSIAKLLKMARKDKFQNYKDIIFHYAGELTLQQPDTSEAIKLFSKSLMNNKNNIGFKNRSHLALGKIAYFQKQYKNAADHYDSLDLNHLPPNEDSMLVAERKIHLRKVANELAVIEKEDSLQAIAMMPPQDRDALIKRLLKKVNKNKKGNEEENYVSGNLLSSDFSGGNNAADLFPSASKGEWYFFNPNMKSRGFNEFRAKWGKRDNVDNWRRISSINNQTNLSGGMADPMGVSVVDSVKSNSNVVDNTYDAYLQALPLTPEALDSSNNRVASSLFTLAQIFEFDLHDEQQAIYLYEIYLQRFPSKLLDGAIYLGLNHCYSKINNAEKASYYKGLLDADFSDSKSAKMLNDPYSLDPLKNNPVVEKRYEAIYNEFVTGNMDAAFMMKKTADSIFGNHYWTPQLLYWEAVYFIKRGQDSIAINTLDTIMTMPSSSVKIKEKATALKEVLKNKNTIENYLNNLNVTRLPNDAQLVAPIVKPIEKQKDSLVIISGGDPQNPNDHPKVNIKKDTLSQVVLPIDQNVFNWTPAEEHLVVMMLTQVDYVYEREAKNAFDRFNQGGIYKNISISKDTFQAGTSLMVFNKFATADEAFKYFDKAKKAASTIISWIQPSKYSFIIISKQNLMLLQKNKSLDKYKKLLNEYYPGKF